jgi:hypothetical protein
MILSAAEEVTKQYLESDDPTTLAPAIEAIESSDIDTFDKIEDLILDYVEACGDRAGEKVIPLAPLMSAKFHSYRLYRERDIWKKVAATYSTEVDDALSALYRLDDGLDEATEGEQQNGQ